MRKKRILSTLLAVSMMSTMFAGCGQTQEEVVENSTVSSVTSEAESSAESSSEAESNTENEEYSTPRISEETITITVEGPSGAVARDWTNSQQFQEYEKRMGLRFEATTYTNEQWDSRLTLMMAGGEMPDALFTSGKMKRSQVKKYIAELRLNGQLPKSLSLDEIPESLKSPVQTWVDACVNGGSDKDYGVDTAIDMVKFMLAAYQSDKEKGKRVTI